MAAHLTRRQRRGTAVAVWAAALAGALGALAGLHALGSHPAFAADAGRLWSWIGAHGPERVLLVLARYAALGLGYWTVGSLVATTVTRATRIPALIRSVDRLTLPAARRIADRVVAVSLAVSSITASGAGVALAADRSSQDSERAPVVRIHQGDSLPPATYVPVPAADAPLVPVPAEEESGHATAPAPAAASTDTLPTEPGAPAPAPDPAPAGHDEAGPGRNGATTDEYVVAAGDNLWVIAQRHLEQVLRRSPSETETARYWAHLVATNRAALRSGDPDLIYPGEIVTCPATMDAGLAG